MSLVKRRLILKRTVRKHTAIFILCVIEILTNPGRMTSLSYRCFEQRGPIFDYMDTNGSLDYCYLLSSKCYIVVILHVSCE